MSRAILASQLLKADRPSRLTGLLAALLSVGLATLAIYPLKQHAPVVSLGIVYVLPVVAVSMFWGLGLGVATSVLSAAAFNFFHLPPGGRFTLADDREWVALVTFVIVAASTGALAELARVRGREAEQRRRSDELKTAVLRSVSHDLRTPLTAILAAATALDPARPTSENVADVREQVIDAATRLWRVIEKLLDLSVLQAGQAEPRRIWYTLEEVLQEAVEHVSSDPALFELSIERDIPLLEGDPAQLERAFANVLENAARYSRGEPVQVGVRLLGDRVRVVVVDRGPGIAQAEQERVFEPFYRAPEERRAHAGSGLGLAITRGFVELNGGHVSVQSRPGRGASFVIEFPVPERQPEQVAIAHLQTAGG